MMRVWVMKWWGGTDMLVIISCAVLFPGDVLGESKQDIPQNTDLEYNVNNQQDLSHQSR